MALTAFRRPAVRLALWTATCTLLAIGEAAPAQDGRGETAAHNALVGRLEELLTLDRGIDSKTPFRDALALIGLNDESRVVVDEQAFRDKHLPNIKEAVFRFSRAVGVSRGLVLRLLLSQANATYEVRGNRVVIVPHRKVAPAPLSKRGLRRRAEIWKTLARMAVLDKGIDRNTRLKDALEFLSDRYDLTILIDTGAFERDGLLEIENEPVSLVPVVNQPLSFVLELLLNQVGGTYEIDDGCVIVVPKPTREAAK